MKKNEELATMTAEKLQAYKKHLTVITNGLINLAKSAGRKRFVKNQLLRECYNLVNDEMHTEEEWNERGAYVKHGEHAYLFWKGEEVEFRFARFHVKFERESDRIDMEYDKIHEEYPDAICLFRCGDFYEVYRDDAQKVCKVLNITLTHRHYSDGSRIEMAGFPFHALDTYLPKLVRAGLRVALCDEMKNGKKGVVETHKK
jgi:DNA mismatch repair protein MutS